MARGEQIQSIVWHLAALAIFSLALALPLRALAAPLNVSLLLGDADSLTALRAVKLLRKELAPGQLEIRVYPTLGLREADRSHLRTSQIVIVNVFGKQVVTMVRDDVRQAAASGARIYLVGSPTEEDAASLDARIDGRIGAYHRAGGAENLANLLRYVVRNDFPRHELARELARTELSAPNPAPDFGIYDPSSGSVYQDFTAYEKDYASRLPGRPWIGVAFYRASLTSGQTRPLQAIVSALERSGYNVLPVFGYPYENPLQRFFLDANGKPRVQVIVALGMKVGIHGATTGATLATIGAPVINAITLSSQSRTQWEASKVGLEIMERGFQIAGAELGGLIQPTVVASRERVKDTETGIDYIEEQEIPERIARLAARVAAWSRLASVPAGEKRVAVLYYNYPHGSETIGAAYLNVLPESLWQILERLHQERYSLQGMPPDKAALQADVQRYGSYPGKDSGEYQRGLRALAESGQAVTVPVDRYRGWFSELAPALRAQIERAWGSLDQLAAAAWRDGRGVPHLIFPARRYANLVLAPQPARAWEQNLDKLHNEVTLPPSHEYVAFYLWLRQRGSGAFGADAIVHLGTHGTHEWLTGKEAGLAADDPSEALIGAVPNIYPYVMDDVGEGLQAKRRGMAVIVDHLTPPFDQAGLNPELRELGALLNDYRIALQKSPLLAESHLRAINRLAKKLGVLKDLKLRQIRSEADMEALEEYLDEVANTRTPYGLHTFGVAPAPESRTSTARALGALEQRLAPQARLELEQKIDQAIRQSANDELDHLSAALAGRYVPAGPGADLIRNAAALPTGRNFFGFDPARIPTLAIYEEGARLAAQLVEGYRSRHGAYPDKLAFHLWGVETSRHEGIMEAQILALMGIKPKWDERGRVMGVEAIPRSALGRPRIDVTIVSSGLFRDLFANLIRLLDDAAALARQQDEADNGVRRNSHALREALLARGIPAVQAERLSGVRIFSLPSGGYGTNLEKLIPLSNTWSDERELADVYFRRMGHLYGRGYWGNETQEIAAAGPAEPGDWSGATAEAVAATLAVDLFKHALSGSKIAVHSRSSNLFATLDNDDFFQYLGGTALAIRTLDGKSPELMVTNLANSRAARQEPLERYMGRELQSRYLNPRWARAMLKEGYAGARFVNRVVDYLWAWQVTAPEVVGAEKWQQIYETYVEDKHGLDVKQAFRSAGNLLAYQAMVDRMLVAVNKGYWRPAPEVVRRLQRENLAAIDEAGIACTENSCSDPRLLRRAPKPLAAAPLAIEPVDAAPPASVTTTPQPAVPEKAATPAAPLKLARPEAGKVVTGLEMVEEKLKSTISSHPVESTLGVLILLTLLFGMGALRRSR